MFTGLIREIGRVLTFTGPRLEIGSRLPVEVGDSVAVNGACLTVVARWEGGFRVELSEETRGLIPVENFYPGARVHLEPAVRVGERLDGHIVQGHLDGIGVVRELAPSPTGGYRLVIEPPRHLIPLLPPKGSVAVDGVSLTIARVDQSSFEVAVIPLTYRTTLIGEYRPGRRVGIETDLLARYLAHYLQYRQLGESPPSQNRSPQTPPAQTPPTQTPAGPTPEELGLLHWW